MGFYLERIARFCVIWVIVFICLILTGGLGLFILSLFQIYPPSIFIGVLALIITIFGYRRSIR
jgi:hypothetical protein